MKRIILFFGVMMLIPLGLTAQQSLDSIETKVGIIAHRGFHRFMGSAENSISAMKYAVAHDFEGTEFDVQLTQDGIAIVFHDNSMQGHVINRTPFDTLCQLPAFILKSGENVPTLDEFLEACSQALQEQRLREKHTQLFFEIKPQAQPEQRYHLIGQIIEAIGKYQLHNDVFFISFDLEACILMSQLMPDVRVAYLEGNLPPEELHARGISGLAYHWRKLIKTPQWIEEAHNLGMTVNVWTVNKPKTAKELLDLGVDYITTDYPLNIRQCLDTIVSK